MKPLCLGVIFICLIPLLEFQKLNLEQIQRAYKTCSKRNNNYENEDIDHSKTYLNYDLVNANKQNFNNLIDEKIEQNYTGKRKIRTDAIKHIDGLITSDNDFFDNQTPEDTKQFLNMLKSFRTRIR